METKQILYKLTQREDLLPKEATFIAKQMMQGHLTPVEISAILVALKTKGETVDEIVSFITVMRENMLPIPSLTHAIDTCGTGGDGQGTFNISSAAAIVVASAGVSVAKHGNRNASSKCGSADVLEALGIPVTITPEQAQVLLKKTGFTFFFAPIYHPSMKHVAPVRKELKVPTIFNMLGPFLSPVRVKRQIIGVPSKKIAELLSQVAKKLAYAHLLILTSDDGLDEISISSPTTVYEIKKNLVKKYSVSPSKFGMKIASKKSILGGDAQENAAIITSIFKGKKGPQTNIVLLNAGAALYVSGKVRSIKDGVLLAQDLVGSGKTLKKFEEIRKEASRYVQT